MLVCARVRILMEGGAMGQLTDFHWETLYEGILRIQATETVDDFAQESLGCIAALVPAKQHILFTFDEYAPAAVKFGPSYTLGTSVHFMDEFLDGPYMREDWMFTRMNLKAKDCAYRDSDIISEEQLVASRVYKDIYERDGVHYGMRLNMANGGKLMGSYSVFRPKDAGDYTDQELEACNKLAPFLSIRYWQLTYSPTKSTDIGSGLTRLEAMDRFGLTMREFQVAEMMSRGLSEDEAAEALSVSPSTVRKHLYNAYAKLAVNKRSQLSKLFGHSSG